MTQPTGNCRNIHPALKTTGGKKMPQIVMSEMRQPALGARSFNGRVTADGVEHPRALFRDTAEELLQGRKDRNGAGLASFGAGFGIATDNHGSGSEIHIAPQDVGRLAQAAPAIGEEFDEVGGVLAPTTSGIPHFGDQFLELFPCGQVELPGFNASGLKFPGGIIPAKAHPDCRLENTTESAETAVESGGRQAREQKLIPPGLTIDDGDLLSLGLGEVVPGLEDVAEGFDPVALAAGLEIGVGGNELLVALDDLTHRGGGRGIGLGIEDFGLKFAVKKASGGFRLGGETAGYKFIFMAHHRVENAGAGISSEIHDSVDLHELAHAEEYKIRVSKCQVLLV